MARHENTATEGIKERTLQKVRRVRRGSRELLATVHSNRDFYSGRVCNRVLEVTPMTTTTKTTAGNHRMSRDEKLFVKLKVKRRKVKVKRRRLSCRQRQRQQQQHLGHNSAFRILCQSYKNYLSNTLIQIPITQWLWLLFCFSSLTRNSTADCPNVCECKWKSGKESVLCLNANLTNIPAPLDPGTQVLDLTGNDIATIPDDAFAVVKLLNLQKIFLAKCRLSVIEKYALRGLINLVELDLSYNSLLTVPSAAFKWITELRELKLNGNPLSLIANNAFSEMQRLVRLELTDCVIAVIDERAFAGLENSLEYLKLDGNHLSNVKSNTITSLVHLHGISLSRNRWNCSCALRPLRAWMLRENIPCDVPPVCKTPDRLAGKAWNKIDLDDFACIPKIIATDSTAHGVEGRNITMTCYVAGIPEPSIRWMIKNRIIANLTATPNVNMDEEETLSNSPRMAAATQGRKTYVVNLLRNASNLTILTADMQDAGVYTCAAENKAGKVEASVTLAVSRRPPEAPLSFHMLLLCMFIAFIFVGGSCVAAVCFCSLRRKRKMRGIWNNVSQDRIDNYEKIEMTSRIHRNFTGGDGASGGGGGSCGGGGSGYGGGSNNGSSGLLRSNEGGRVLSSTKQEFARKIANRQDTISKSVTSHFFHSDENGYLCTATTPLNCDSNSNIGDASDAIINPSSGGSLKRNGDYRKIPTHCDDDDMNENSLMHDGKKNPQPQQDGGGSVDYYRSLFVTTNCTAHSTNSNSNNALSVSANSTITTTADGLWKSGVVLQNYQDSARNAAACKTDSAPQPDNKGSMDVLKIIDDTDLHIPRLIDIGSLGDSCSASISGKVDINDRSNGPGYNHLTNWVNKSLCSSNSKGTGTARTAATDYYTIAKDINKSVLCDKDGSDNDLFDSNYPDLLDIAKYAVAQATSSSQANGGLCTLPRKLKNSAKYYKNSSDSQSPLLADNSSKYGSSILGDAAYLNELALGRRFSAESSYTAYSHNTLTYSKGQRSNSYLNLIHSTNSNKNTLTGKAITTTSSSSTTTTTITETATGTATTTNTTATAIDFSMKRNPSLPSSPAHDTHLQHQRSFSSAATPLLDFSTLTTRIGSKAAKSNTATPNGALPTIMSNSITSTPVAAYDYHAAQLERFLEEYRNLQDQLCKMKETCETIRMKEVPLRVGHALGHAARTADPVMYSAALMAAAQSPNSNPKMTLKSKTILPGQPPDPPPYWLHRNALLKRLNESQNEIFKS